MGNTARRGKLGGRIEESSVSVEEGGDFGYRVGGGLVF